MQVLKLDVSTEAYLTDRITGKLIPDGDGNAQRVAQDEITGKFYKKIADVIPGDDDPRSKARKAAILQQNPVTARNIPGFWVELPDYTPVLTDAELAAANAAQK